MVAMATGIDRGVNLNSTVRLPDPKNRGYVNTARNFLLREPSYTALMSP